MEPIYNGENVPMTREREEFLRWWRQREVLAQVKRLSKWFAAAFFLETLLLYVVQGITVVFWQVLDSAGIFDSNALWEIANETFAVVYYLAIFLPPYLLYARMVKFNLRDIPRARLYAPVTLATTGFAMGVSLAGGILASVALGFFQQFFGLMPPQFPSTPDSALGMALYLLTTLVLPPLIEELVYRGILLGSLRQFGDAAAIIISSLLFGLSHGNMAQFPYSFVLGLTMAFFVVKTGSIYTSVFIHFVNNALATFMELFTANMSDMAAYMVSSLELLVDLCVFVLALVYLIGVRRADWKLHPGPVPGGAVTRQFFLTAPMVLVLVVMGYNILTSFT